MKTLIIAVLALSTIIATPANGATYYISTSGSDSNAGTSSSPWRRCPGMPGWSGSASLKAGDVVYFKSDDTWNISSGSYALSVVGGVAYDGRTWGDGTRAKFNVESDLAGNIIVRFNDDDNTYETSVVGFDFDGNGYEVTGIGFGRFYTGSLLGTTKRVEDCLIHHCGNANESGYNYGIFTGPTGGNTHRNIQVINCVIHDTGRSALCNYVNRDNANNKTENVWFRGNEVYNAGLNVAGSSGMGILLKDHSENTVVEFNYVHDCPYGLGLEAASPHTYGPQNATIRYNIIADNYKRAVYVQKVGAKSFDMYGNIVYRNDGYGLYLESNNTGDVTAKVYNNTFYENCQSSGTGEIYLSSASGAIEFDIRNNLIVPKNGVRCIVDSNGSYITAHKNNLLYRADGGTLVISGGSSYSSSNISSWENTAQTANPGFMNTGNLPRGFSGVYGTDLVPKTDGLLPTQNVAGMGVTLPTEFAGAINQSGLSSAGLRQIPWDIGAYNLAVDSNPPPIPDNLIASAISTTQINLVWDASSGATEYRVYRDGTYLATTTGTSYSDTGLAASTTYTYTVRASTAGSLSNPSPSAPATTFTSSPTEMTSTTDWQNRSFAPQSGQFAVEYDAIPDGSNIDGVTGLSLGNVSDYSALAVTPRFYTSGQVDARNGTVYESDVPFNYTAGKTYHFRLLVDIPAHKYRVYVKEVGGNEVLLAEDYSFRTGQDSVSSLDTLAFKAGSGSYQILNFTVTPAEESVIPEAPTGLHIDP